MKELKRLTRKEKVEVSIQCDSFFLTVNKLKNSRPIFTQLENELNLPPNHSKELWMVITMVGKALRSGCSGSQIPMKNETYVTANKLHKLGLNRTRARNIILALEDHGYLDFYTGFKDFKHDISIMSCVIFKDKLMGMFPDKLIKMYGYNISIDEMVLVRDSKTKEDLSKLTRFKGIGESKAFMFEYNKCLSLHDIRLMHRKCKVIYKQIFSDNLVGAGRIYSFGLFQTSPSELRRLITIDGEKVTEADLRANHISMLYLLNGIKLSEDFDCYKVNLQGYSYQEIRALCKMAIMCMINCKSIIGATKALQKIVDERDDEDLNFIKFPSNAYDFYKDVINKLVWKHNKINFFKTGEVLWKKLQRLDSKVCEYVLKHFTSKKEVVLGYHDSWIVVKRLQNKLVEVIKEGWFSVFGTYDNCFIKIDY